jgi:hypothetical protein
MTTLTKIDHESLREAGYKKFPALLKPHCLALWQKTVNDNIGVKFAIDIYEYPEISNINYNYVDYIPSVQLETSIGIFDINHCALKDINLLEIESSFDNMWKFMNAKYKEYYVNDI